MVGMEQRRRSGPRRAVQLLYEVIGIEAAPRPIREWLEIVIAEQSWAASAAEASEKAEKWEALALTTLETTLRAPDVFGRPKLLALNSSSPYLIQGAAFVEPCDDELTRKHKARRRNIIKLREGLRGLSDRAFELCCARILSELGARDTVATQFSGDEGIDFYGRLRLEEFLHSADLEPTIQTQLTVWMVGQAKHYQRVRVSTPDIRELVGSVELARSRAFGSLGDMKYPDLRMRLCDPIFRLFLTTGEISQHGWVLLSASGVVGMDGLMLAGFLADRGVGISGDDFDQDAFYDLLCLTK
jgi:Restriction endonuclease